MSKNHFFELKLAPLAAALLVAFGNSYAQQTEEVRALTSPDTRSVTVGAGVTNGESNSRRFGQYTGLNKDGAVLLDFESVTRDDATGTWTNLSGRNLGLDTRELNFSRQVQGDWKFGADYNEIVRNDPYVINTGMTGIGSSSPVINLIKTPAMPAAWATATGLAPSNGVAGHDESLKLKRTALGIGGDKWISSGLQLEVNFRNEDKKGARMFGRVGIASGDELFSPTQGTGASGGTVALLLTPEPIDSNIRTIETKLNFSRDKLALTGGYYGSFYTNNVQSLTPVVPGVLNRGALWNGGVTPAGCANLTGACSIQQSASAAVALPADNQAHQLYFSGTYAYSDTTRTNFKLAYTHATQDESFTGAGLSPSATAPASLGGALDTTLLQFGLSMRPVKDLSVNASVRYEDRNDLTAVRVYNYGKLSTGVDATNNWASGSQTRTDAKVDATYRLPSGYSVFGGAEWERKKNPVMPNNTAIYGTGGLLVRETTDESGARLGVRKAMSEQLNGALSVEFKQRRSGDDWKSGDNKKGNTVITVSSLGNYVLPDMYMDRDRTKVRANLEWDPSEALSVQAVVEHAQDDYLRSWTSVSQVILTVPGARTVSTDSVTLDATYKLTDAWKLSGYWTHTENRWNVNKASLGDDTKNMTDTIGFGVSGKASARLNVGADLLAANDVTKFNNYSATSSVGGIGNIAGWSAQSLPGNYLPTITYSTLKLNLYGVYEVDKKSSVKVNLAYQEFKADDWQWGYNGVPFVYSDNTTVSNPNQTVTFLGVAYVLKF
jgi:MtrB/PioB family decaheme-associated outer membrane protein